MKIQGPLNLIKRKTHHYCGKGARRKYLNRLKENTTVIRYTDYKDLGDRNNGTVQKTFKQLVFPL